jgi:hypothetical protein
MVRRIYNKLWSIQGHCTVDQHWLVALSRFAIPFSAADCCLSDRLYDLPLTTTWEQQRGMRYDWCDGVVDTGDSV